MAIHKYLYIFGHFSVLYFSVDAESGDVALSDECKYNSSFMFRSK